MLACWSHEQEGSSPHAVRHKNEAVSSEEFERMRRELTKVTTERDILKRRWGVQPVNAMTPLVYRSPPQRVAYANNVPCIAYEVYWRVITPLANSALLWL
jgi:hypothetical protein